MAFKTTIKREAKANVTSFKGQTCSSVRLLHGPLMQNSRKTYLQEKGMLKDAGTAETLVSQLKHCKGDGWSRFRVCHQANPS